MDRKCVPKEQLAIHNSFQEHMKIEASSEKYE